MRRPYAIAAVLVLILSAPSGAALPDARPDEVGLDPVRLERIGAAIRRAIDAEGLFPGAVVLVGRRGKVAYAGAFGDRAVAPKREAMTRDTIFDLASLTKPVATATLVMMQVERGEVRLEDRITRYLPEFDDHGKGAITVEQLLRHRAGLIADDPLSDYADGPDDAWKRIAHLGLVAPPGERFLYSDVGYLILGRLVERVAEQELSRLAQSTLFGPLGMRDTGFVPLDRLPKAEARESLARIAPTEKGEEGWLRGVVHDPRARTLGGVAGHAGLFGTADDLAVFAQMLLDGGKARDGTRVLAPLTVRAMIDPGDTPRGQRRGLGWDIDTPYAAPRGALFGPRSFGHTGFTGTSLWIDPETQTFIILLTSRLHPDGGDKSLNGLRHRVATLAAAAIVDAPPFPTGAPPAPEPVDAGHKDVSRDHGTGAFSRSAGGHGDDGLLAPEATLRTRLHR